MSTPNYLGHLHWKPIISSLLSQTPSKNGLAIQYLRCEAQNSALGFWNSELQCLIQPTRIRRSSSCKLFVFSSLYCLILCNAIAWNDFCLNNFSIKNYVSFRVVNIWFRLHWECMMWARTCADFRIQVCERQLTKIWGLEFSQWIQRTRSWI
jgi:hypothetical protein